MLVEAFILFILILLSACFSGIEIAFFSLSNIKVMNLVEKKVKNAKTVKKLKDNPEKLLITILIGNNVVNIGAASYATVVATSLFGSSGVGIATGVMTFLVLVFGEITPKSIANAKNEKISLFAAKPMQLLIYILYPIILILELITRGITKLTGGKVNNLVSEEELKIMARVGVQEQAIEEHEGEIIRKAFELNDITAADIMTIISKVELLDANMNISSAMPLIAESAYSRIPIYKGEKRNIVGLVYFKDLLLECSQAVSGQTAENSAGKKLIDISREPLFIPAQRLLDDLLKDFQRKHIQMAMVVDEDGTVIGLVTLEDILEELVGEIIDETDVEQDLIKRLDKNSILVDGLTRLEDIMNFFNIVIKYPKKEFISKYLLEKFEKLPKVGDEIEIDNITYFISDANNKKIRKIRITKR